MRIGSGPSVSRAVAEHLDALDPELRDTPRCPQRGVRVEEVVHDAVVALAHPILGIRELRPDEREPLERASRGLLGRQRRALHALEAQLRVHLERRTSARRGEAIGLPDLVEDPAALGAEPGHDAGPLGRRARSKIASRNCFGVTCAGREAIDAGSARAAGTRDESPARSAACLRHSKSARARAARARISPIGTSTAIGAAARRPTPLRRSARGDRRRAHEVRSRARASNGLRREATASRGRHRQARSARPRSWSAATGSSRPRTTRRRSSGPSGCRSDGDAFVEVRRIQELSDFPEEIQEAAQLSQDPPHQTSA